MDSIRPWSNLPEGIVELIINKLHFRYQIRAVAVCKNWRNCKDYVRCSGCLPWVISSQRPFNLYSDSDSDGDDGFAFLVADPIHFDGDLFIDDDIAIASDSDIDFNSDSDDFIVDDASDIGSDDDSGGDVTDGGNDVRPSVRELFDPYSREVKKVSNPIIMDPNGSYIPLAAKNGWVWALFACKDSSKVLLHNPFTDEVRSVYPFPNMKMDLLHAAFKGDPSSIDFEIFTIRICADELHVDIVKRDGYTSDFIVQKLAASYDFIYDVLYVDGYLYCLFRRGELYRYGLEDGSWNFLTSGFPEPYELYYNMSGDWLLEIENNLIMVHMDVEDETHTWMIFRFDWTKMSWVDETSLKSCAIYISDFLAFSTPLISSKGEILEGCRLFHNEERVVKCYSMSEPGGVVMESEEFSWITRPSRFQLSFIERPYIGI